MSDVVVPLLLIGLVLALAANGALLLRARKADRARAAAERNEALERQRMEEHAVLLRHLADKWLPAVARRLVSPQYPVPAPPPSVHDLQFAHQVEELVEQLNEVVEAHSRRVDDAAQAALRGTCQDVQALTYRMQDRLEKALHTYDEPGLAGDLMELDHLNEQAARLLQRAAIVCGGWAGQVREDTRIAEVVRGASSRVAGYRRVAVSSRLATDEGISGRAAEPAAAILAELVANALENSRDDFSVEVSIAPTESGAVVTIDDAGKGMTAETLARGQRLVAGEPRVRLTDLGDPPALGLAAIGRLAHDHGLGIALDGISPYGGVRAIVTIPSSLRVSVDPVAQPASALAPVPAPAPSAAPTDASGLPQRRRRVSPSPTDTGSIATPVERRAPGPSAIDPDQAGERWGDWQQGLSRGRDNDN